jgi:deoxyribose-phosphate aldolase
MASTHWTDVPAQDHAIRKRFLAGEGQEDLLPQLIDATLLNKDLLRGDIEDLAMLAVKERVRAICIPPALIRETPVAELRAAGVLIATVINFPMGYQTIECAEAEAERAVRDGANELDFVQPIYLAKNQEWRRLEDFSRRLVEGFPNVTFKVILETGMLSITDVQTCVRCHALAGVHVMKTSTGFGPRGASVADVQTIWKTLVSMGLGNKIGIKASGGIASRIFAEELIQSGATRIGTSRVLQVLGKEM